MSFRFRVLGLVMFVALSATCATAWLTLRQAREQLAASASASQEQVDMISSELKAYGSRQGTWEGVADLVIRLHQDTGQRIHLESDLGVLVDTDTVRDPGRAFRPLGPLTAVVNPRPTLSLGGTESDPAGITVKAIGSYRSGVLFAACLTRRGLDVVSSGGALGVPTFEPGPDIGKGDLESLDDCRASAAEAGRNVNTDIDRTTRCVTSDGADNPDGGPPQPVLPGRAPVAKPGADFTDPRLRNGVSPTATPVSEAAIACLTQVFNLQINDVAPQPVRLYLGAQSDPGAVLTTGPVLAGVAGVAGIAVLCTALLSHRVIRPIGRLTAAAQRLGRGDLSGRVPVSGRDELAKLGRSFNQMADSLQRGEERQRRLVADVAHELRSPLANLRGYLEALKDGVIKPDPELFASLHEEAVLQQRIVDDLQELALAEAGTLAYHRVHVDLAELLETCQTAHRALAEAAGVTLRVVAEPVVVHADPDRLRQVVGNLITNALRATAAGGNLTLHASRAGAGALIRVSDDGCGIAPDALAHVFDRFWRADSARGRGTGGSGLGLAITRQIVTDHGGTITVASELGVGTTFSIVLPAVAAE
ncbi:two-component system sensor histidine kinase BaeS [Micromonospora pisi]|uniref:histidine kinase n=1 Tax=Micromonospora pisi TaxID=589240 RepID=A0A495JQT3_9ACTN|nr:ATP-binding protein [Micromonospora pisi]RKR91337.1 two-component system sensor histidine kinase BaeS [Micromonospora pisi]